MIFLKILLIIYFGILFLGTIVISLDEKLNPWPVFVVGLRWPIIMIEMFWRKDS